MSYDGVICFGPYEIDPRSLELRRDGGVLPLEPLPTRILARLASDLGTMVPRDDLLALGWAGTPWVAEQALNTCIYQIRKALAESGSPAVELETLRGRGYRLSLLPVLGADQPAVGRASGRWLALLVLLVSGVVAGALWILPVGDPSSGVPSQARLILDRAEYLVRETHDLEAARATLDSGRASMPAVAALQAEWGEVNVWLGDLEAAARGAERALELDPRSATAHRTKGALAMLRSDWGGADAELARALGADARDTRTLTALAFLRTIQGRFEDAQRLVQRALRIDPLSATIHLDAGLAYLRMGRYEDAERYCREALRFKPRSFWATDCLFDVTVLMGRTEEAARWGRRLRELYDASRLSDDLPPELVVERTEAWRLQAWIEAVDRGAYPLGLALAYAANGRAEEAIEALRAAAERPRLGLLVMGVDPRLAGLHRYVAFRELLDRLDLPSSPSAAHHSARSTSNPAG